ncbi:hypothetical protein IMSHALPRED_007170 [Imshaugia aleurites]|uniref:RRM domain-containing protein n=1 Tax=Imshaugia aleurites TaxID=172621 RepID=A0A8H3FMD1_9LECA|nr:hypothetical protein IMSHALPRED_007170 [Imshaugia aleurites]
MSAVAVHAGVTNPPNPTVYVKNLEERIKPDQLKEALTEIFSEYGNVIELVAKTNLRAKGQAFVVFDETEAAERAIKEVQGFELFDKPMLLDYARTKSDATVQREGSAEDFEAHRRRRLAEKERKQAYEAAEAQKKLKRPAAGAPPEAGTARPVKASRGAGLKSSNPAAGAVIPEEYLPPNKILFVQNLPEDYGVDGLTAIFGRFEGFREVRLVPGRRGIAFVEYEAEAGAISAKENTAGMALGEEGKVVKVVYQRQ